LQTRYLRFDINLLARRTAGVLEWLNLQPYAYGLKKGLFGSGTGAAAALMAAAELPDEIDAVVSRGGRPDLAGAALQDVEASTLLIVGGNDDVVIDLNKQALETMSVDTQKKLIIVPEASHLFEEPGSLDEAAYLARDWFQTHLDRVGVR
jgi:dienelactone hydrolase